jgi:hypothetical protein
MGSALSRIVGVGCLAGAVYVANLSIEFRRHGEIVTGTVVAIDAKVTHDDGAINYSERAEILYTPKGGKQPLRLHSNWASGLFSSNDIGDKVSVRYLPDRPEEARQDSLLFDWLAPLALLVLGLAGVTGRLQSSDPETTLWSSRRE